VAVTFARRRWLPLSATVIFVATLLAGILATSYQARRAERRFQQVRELANTLMIDVHQAIRDLPASTPAQEVIVRTALGYLDDLAAEVDDDPALQTEIAEGYLKVGLLAYSFRQPSLGRPEEARDSYRKAERILGALATRAGADPRVAIARTRLDLQVGELLYETGQAGDAFTAIERAIATAEAAIAREPGHFDLLSVLADAQAALITRFDARPAASRHVARYLDVAEQLARQQPESAKSISDLGVAYSQAGRLAASLDQHEEASRYFRRNIDQQNILVAREPENTAARRNLMIAWSNLADLALGPLGTYSASGAGGPQAPLDPARRREAREAWNRVVEQAEWRYARDPSNDNVVLDYAISLGRRAPSYPPGDAGAIGDLERSLSLLDRLQADNPGPTGGFIIEFRGSLAERLRQAGQMARAEAEWRRIDGIVQRALATDPDNYLPRRQVLPIVVNRALALAEAGERDAAIGAARRAEVLAAEVAARESQYQRAAGWPPRVQGWLAEVHARLGDAAAAARSRDASLALWRAVAARDSLPDDLLNEARAAIARAGGSR
jgi:tetratricopeptide (TPR) repeat protein